MSIELIENEIRQFLSSNRTEVICISGQWGVGKTFAWDRLLKSAHAKGQVALKRYSYVSLFGLNSLDEFKYSIFENSIQSSQIGIEPSLETLESSTTATIDRFGRKSLWFLQQIPFVRNHIGGLGPVWFLSVKETIICVDDIERKGASLSIRDVLGLTSQLKERKGCKIVLILNDEAMPVEDKDFRMYFEKVVDISLRFAPTAEDSVRIALDRDSEINVLLRQYCITLGISNIRLIKKIENISLKIEMLLKDFDPQVKKQALHSITLLMWSIYEPVKAPSVDFLRRRGISDSIALSKDYSPPPNEAAWSALLDVYSFRSMDEFDLAILTGIQSGFFDPLLIRQHASELNKKLNASQLKSSFIKAWEIYHDSFDDNEDQVLDAIYQSFLKDIQNISPTNLAGTVTLFKELGRHDRAHEILQLYLASRNAKREFYDLRNDPFSDNITDSEVIKAFQEKYAEFKDERDPADILLDIAKNHSWNQEDLNTLALVPADHYRRIFKEHRGQELRGIINSCLQFDNMSGTSVAMREIAKRAREALRRIGAESAINARRVRKFGVMVDDTPADGSEDS